MKITVSSRIDIEDPDKEVTRWCMANLILDNPQYAKNERLGYSNYNTPRQIQLYEVVGNTYRLPFGCLDNLWQKYKDYVPFKSEITPIQRFNYRSNIKPYPYQENAIKRAITVKNGIIVAPCGGGKTNVALEVIARVGAKALWLTHTTELLNQSKDRAKSVFDCDKSAFGTITAGKVNISNGITFATVQTMARLDLPQYKDEWSIIVVDEVHRASMGATSVKQFQKVLMNLSARYKIGLTATPYRGDGLTKAMFALVGNTIYTITKEDVADTTCPVKVRRIDTGYEPLDLSSVLNADGTLDYHGLVADLISNDTRYLLISHEINSLDGPAIVLANRVDYLKWLMSAYEGKAVCLSGLTASRKNKEMRKKALSGLQSGEIDCIFATYSLAAEGLDCPGLRYVVFATPEKDERIITQSVGRVARKCEGKEYGTVIDFVDDFGLFKRYWSKRKNIYKKLDCEVLE